MLRSALRAATLCVLAVTPLAAQSRADALKAIRFRSVGPTNMGGRTTDVDGIPGDPTTFYVSGADGGIFKTTNGGITWREIFNDQPVYSIGALQVAPSDHNVLWVGTGEGDPRNSTSYGNGVYRSLNGGETWTYLGLGDTERIKRIMVDPRDPDVALVCALGHAWGANEERGVFRTTDGGKTWEKVLYVDEDTGCSDLTMDLSNPRILFAGMWTFRRLPWRFDDGGKETAVYRSLDGGDTWQKLHLTDAPMARIGVDIAQSHPETVYVISEIPDMKGELWRSDDRGETWRVVNTDPNINFRPFYYSDIHVDPTNPEVLYTLSGRLSKSTDGGRTFQRIANDVHGDHQSFWIDPADSNHLISGSDGGFQVSFDAGENFDVINNVTLSQFYEIFTDDRDPYWICGGLQDNGHWCGPSNSLNRPGILKDDWINLSGGDGFYAVPVPGMPWLVYTASQGGNIILNDTRTGASRRVHPYPKIVGSAGDAIVNHRYRFNWDAPIAVSPHDPATVYFGGNVLFRSRDFGNSWDVISPDLTTDDPAKQQSSGGEIYTDNTAAEFYTTIVTIAESPVQPGVIWAGTDDGNIQVTQDGGDTWANVAPNVEGMPEGSWISKIDASWHDAGTAWVAVDDHRSDDFTPHAYVTRDYGRTWEDISDGLPGDDYVKVVREDPKNPDLLYLGMERGLFASWDGGKSWTSIRNNIPPVSVRDIKIQREFDDLVVGTHGRGAYILDDLSAFQELGDAMADPDGAYLFPIRLATRWQIANKDANLGQRRWRGDNPPEGALIRYYLAAAPSEPLTLEISDAQGHVVSTSTLRGAKPGVNETTWNLQYEGPTPIPGEDEGGFGRFGGGGPTAVPGTYTATLEGDGWERSQTFDVRGDPRVEMTEAQYRAQFQAVMALRDLTSRINHSIGTAESVMKQLDDLAGTLTGMGDDASLIQEVKDARAAVQEVSDEYLRRPPPRMGYRQRPRVSEQLRTQMGAISGVEAPPTEPQTARVEELRGQVQEAIDALNQVLDTKVKALNDELGDRPHIMIDRPRVIS
ncbi:MAG: hypothetical protein PVJ02_08975 [Gemmatimonadota bacterium]|jgi:photosystem II stability/assembly factor-like uncharacterized protein